MSKAKKNDKPSDSDDSEPEMAPWAIEIEFFNKPSFMCSILELTVDKEHIAIVKDDQTILAFPRDAVRKILTMHTKK